MCSASFTPPPWPRATADARDELVVQQLAIIGAGGFGREVLDLVESANDAGADYEVLGFIVDPVFARPGTMVNGKPVLGGFDWLAAHAADVVVTCAVGAPEDRLRLVQRAQQAGARFCSLVHPSVERSRHVEIGIGVIVNAGCVVTTNVHLGDHAQVHVGSCVSHDATVAPFATLSPGVLVSGNVTIGEGAFLGTGAAVIQRMRVGAWSVVGAGSTVIRDVADNTTVVGVPARILKTRPPGWHLETTVR
jgi:sugar O-acyltransferase (sialic acid O-acetyltransferase NeuD family)